MLHISLSEKWHCRTDHWTNFNSRIFWNNRVCGGHRSVGISILITDELQWYSQGVCALEIVRWWSLFRSLVLFAATIVADQCTHFEGLTDSWRCMRWIDTRLCHLNGPVRDGRWRSLRNEAFVRFVIRRLGGVQCSPAHFLGWQYVAYCCYTSQILVDNPQLAPCFFLLPAKISVYNPHPVDHLSQWRL